MDVIYLTIFNCTLNNEREALAALQRQLRMQYEDELAVEGPPNNTKKRQRAMERVETSQLHEEFCHACSKLDAEEDHQNKLLNILAPKIEMKPDTAMHLIQVISNISLTDDAEVLLKPFQDLLNGHGFITYLRRTRHHFELWSDCPPYMADAAYRVMELSCEKKLAQNGQSVG